MEPYLDTLSDDLRVRLQFFRCFRHHSLSFPPFLSHPFTVILGVGQGRALMGFADRSRKPVTLEPKDIVIIPACVRRHTRTMSEDGAELLVAGYEFTVRGGIDLLNLLEIPRHLDQATNNQIFALLLELNESSAEAAAASGLLASIRGQRIGYAILETILGIARVRPRALAMRRIFPVIEQLGREFDKRPDIPGLIRASGLSRRHFFRMFKAQTGITPFEFIKRKRLREALLLLQESDLTVAEIGIAVGWPDAFYFSKLFKASIGMSPSKYRHSYGR